MLPNEPPGKSKFSKDLVRCRRTELYFMHVIRTCIACQIVLTCVAKKRPVDKSDFISPREEPCRKTQEQKAAKSRCVL